VIPRFLLLVVIGLWVQVATAKSIDIEPADSQFALQLERKQGISDNWSFWVNTGYKRMWESPLGHGEWKSGHLASSFSYRKNARLNFDLGSGFYYTSRARTEDLSELRTWVGATAYWPDSPGYVRRFVLTHRLRFEQRFFRLSSSGDRSFGSRARYRISTAIAINRKQIEPGAFFSFLSAEFFANFDQNNATLFNDRNQFSAGLGWMSPSKWTLELRMTRQEVKDTSTGDFRITDMIYTFRVKSTVRIRDLMKAH
jgi:hypothetical protein